MYVVILGSGRVGLNLASFLISDGQDVTLIESDAELCSKAASELDSLVICGNGTDIKTLKEANIEDADVFVAATGNDEVNLLTCVLVKGFNVPKIIARVSDYTHKKAFKSAGIDFAISPELTAASYLEKIILRPKIADLVVLGRGDAELLDLTLKNKSFIGKKIGEISPTKKYIIVAVFENGNINIPMQDDVLKEGSKISILVKTKYIKDIIELFTD
ncbi:MAG: TrkA family potassium uptake protein [Methanobacterium sp.]|uniref:potassium channel family protein n=1 Tax=Methanobacterium sp. TaxID=2164 RepID=UPI003D658496|nr:TrkA family potassium uptake protein [Methanobacterium sp.]